MDKIISEKGDKKKSKIFFSSNFSNTNRHIESSEHLLNHHILLLKLLYQEGYSITYDMLRFDNDKTMVSSI